MIPMNSAVEELCVLSAFIAIALEEQGPCSEYCLFTYMTYLFTQVNQQRWNQNSGLHTR